VIKTVTTVEVVGEISHAPYQRVIVHSVVFPPLVIINAVAIGHDQIVAVIDSRSIADKQIFSAAVAHRHLSATNKKIRQNGSPVVVLQLQSVFLKDHVYGAKVKRVSSST
jgi:hypothetical protein